MTAAVYLHPRSVDYFGLYGMLSQLKTRGYEVPIQSGRFFRAFPDAPPAVRPPPSSSPTCPVVPFERRARPFNLWWPRT